MSDDPARQFLDVFNEIERLLKARLGLADYLSPKAMAKRYREAGGITEEQRLAIVALTELRNAISHASYLNGAPIAEPRRETIEDADRIRAFLKDPPLALEVLEKRAVRQLEATDPIEATFSHVQEDFSQFPVYSQGAYQGLLTTNAIARWLAYRCTTSMTLPEHTTAADLLAFSETTDRAAFLPASALVPQAVETLTSDAETVRAVILTASGEADDEPLCLAVHEDLHALYKAIPA